MHKAVFFFHLFRKANPPSFQPVSRTGYSLSTFATWRGSEVQRNIPNGSYSRRKRSSCERRREAPRVRTRLKSKEQSAPPPRSIDIFYRRSKNSITSFVPSERKVVKTACRQLARCILRRCFDVMMDASYMDEEICWCTTRCCFVYRPTLMETNGSSE